jgi:hypothetical protein
MNLGDCDPLVVLVSRDEVERRDISTAASVFTALLSCPESVRDFRERVDIAFDGYDHVRDELFEIPEVRNYVYTLDEQFPHWLYFLSRDYFGLQCVMLCFLPPFLTEEARGEIHPKRLADLLEHRWLPALYHLCSSSGLGVDIAEALEQSAADYFITGPKHRTGYPCV